MTDPVLLAGAITLVASVIFALSNHVQHIALNHMNVRNGTLVNVATSAAVMWLAAPAYLEPSSMLAPAALWFALSGLFVPSFSMTLHTLSVRVIGPALTSGMTSTSPVFAMAIAVLALGEIVTANILTGTAIVVGGIGFVAMRSRGGAVEWPLWAILIPLGAALIRAVSHNVVKYGLIELPSPMTAALIGSTTSTIILLLVHFASGTTLPRWNAGYAWFALCGVMNGIGLVALMSALGIGQVVVVAPIVATVPAFTLITGWLFFRHETVPMSTIIAMALVFCGCVLIVS